MISGLVRPNFFSAWWCLTPMAIGQEAIDLSKLTVSPNSLWVDFMFDTNSENTVGLSLLIITWCLISVWFEIKLPDILLHSYPIFQKITLIKKEVPLLWHHCQLIFCRWRNKDYQPLSAHDTLSKTCLIGYRGKMGDHSQVDDEPERISPCNEMKKDLQRNLSLSHHICCSHVVEVLAFLEGSFFASIRICLKKRQRFTKIWYGWRVFLA